MFVHATAQAAADPAKVLHWYFEAAESGFDPAKVSDLYSATVDEAIFERLLTYDYLARPAKLVPMAAEAMPDVADGGRHIRFTSAKGIYFTPDPAFKEKKRELTAATTFTPLCGSSTQPIVHPMRSSSPENSSGSMNSFRGRKHHNHFNYDAKIPGIEAVDRYTLRFRLKQPDYNFLILLPIRRWEPSPAR